MVNSKERGGSKVDFEVLIVYERRESEVSHTFYEIAKSFFVVIL